MTGRKTRGDSKTDARKRKCSDPTKDAPFRVDPEVDGDFALPRDDVSEDELKEEQDRRP